MSNATSPSARPTYSPEQIDRYFDHIKLPDVHRKHDFSRISPQDALEHLTAIQKHQLAAVPFENLSLHYSPHHQLSLHPENLYRKMVEGGNKGGYCMENNCFFGTVMRTLGFRLYSAGARVFEGEEGLNGWYDAYLMAVSRSHMINIVNIGGKRYMVDVGFGANGATHPMPLEDGTLSTNISPANVRLLWKNIDENEDKEQKLWVFQHQNDEQSEWRDMYCFTQLEFLPQDYKVMNYFTSTNRACFFTYKVVCTKMILEGDELVGNLILQNDMKRRLHGKTEHIETFENEGQRLAALRKWFGIVFTRDEVDGIKGMVSELRANGPGM